MTTPTATAVPTPPARPRPANPPPAQDAAATDSTTVARTESLISPRFYRTDFDALDRIDLTPVRAEWDALMAEFEGDNNKNHFKRDARFEEEVRTLPPALMKDFIDFMITSVTSEYSGHVLYADSKEAVDNPDIKKVMSYMARDEARHAGFINRSLRDFGLGVNLSFLRKAKDYTFFKPKFIFYATYLSEKIGYARYITIFRHLERHPEHRFHPMFRWFEQWCNDEFRHGEVFALIMRADPKLLSGVNQLWIRFFLLAVYATMYVRDHTRPALYEALGMDITDYDLKVLRITSEISKQIFPLTLNLDDPRFRRGLDRLVAVGEGCEKARERGGIIGKVRLAGWKLAGALTFARLYLLPVNRHELPADVRLKPAW